jgi:hypothetical protein
VAFFVVLSFLPGNSPILNIKSTREEGREKIWHDTQGIVPQKDGSIVFEAEVAGTEEIKFWVMSWGSKAEVLEPPSLREEIRVEAEAAVEKYGKSISAQPEPVSALFSLENVIK